MYAIAIIKMLPQKTSQSILMNFIQPNCIKLHVEKMIFRIENSALNVLRHIYFWRCRNFPYII